MDNIILGERVSELESLFGHFMNQTSKAINSLSRDTREYRKEAELDRKKRDKEMKEFKDEMKEFKEEMKEYRITSEKRIKSNEAQIAASSIEMQEFKRELKEDRRKMNKQWGELSNKLGTVVEDLIAPAVRPVVQKYFHEDIVDFSVNRKKHLKSIQLKGEFDVIAISDTTVYLVEVKSAPRKEHLETFARNIENFKKLFPEYSKLPIVPVFATIRFEDDFIPQVTQAGFFALAYREWDFMDLLNFNELTDR